MNRRTQTLGALALGAACAIAGAAPAGADLTTHSSLRVEAGGEALEPGTNYSNRSITTQNTNACGNGGDSATERVRGASALGIIGHAARVNNRLSPFRTSDRFGEGTLVCRIGDFGAFDQNRFWLYKVNHEFAELAGDRLAVDRGDEVLWYFANYASDDNTGDELDLESVPRRVAPGSQFEVRTVGYDGGGQRTNAEGVVVEGGAAPSVSGADGTALVTAPTQEGLITLRGERDPDIPTAPVTLCVENQAEDCPTVREEYVGTSAGDLIKSSDAPDLIKPKQGADRVRAGGDDDYIYARGGRDTIVCGLGEDVVKTVRGEDEFPADDCEDKRFPE